MPAPLVNTSIKSDHLSAALAEISFRLQAAELAVPEETRPNNISVTIDAEAGTAAITATLPVTISLNADGEAVVVATDYIP